MGVLGQNVSPCGRTQPDVIKCPVVSRRLYDNPQIAQTYLDAFRMTGNTRYAHVVRGILDYLVRDMRHEEGGFFSAEVCTPCSLLILLRRLDAWSEAD